MKQRLQRGVIINFSKCLKKIPIKGVRPFLPMLSFNGVTELLTLFEPWIIANKSS